MGKAGFLPDVTGSFGYWRHQKDSAIKNGDFDEMSRALNHMNGALEKDYRITISTELWESQNDLIVWKCNECTTIEIRTINKGEENEYEKEVEVPTCSERKDIKIFTETSSTVIQILSGQDERKMWVCPNCRNISTVESVQSQLRTHESPHYRGCIYEQPTRPQTGLQRRRGSYPNQMREWGTKYSAELERKLALYRIEYIRVMGEDMIDVGYQDQGDKKYG